MKTRLLSIAAAAMAAQAVFATPVTVLYSGGGDYGGNFKIAGGLDGARAGHLQNSWSLGYGSGGAGNPFLAYCLTPTSVIGSGGNPWDADRNFWASYGQIGWLANRPVANTYDKASVQVAIWTVLGSVVTGNDAWSQGVVTNANLLVTASIGQTGSVNVYTRRYSTDDGQDLVEAVPEPFTLALGASALGLAIARRRARKA